jgi:hypothetical protein
MVFMWSLFSPVIITRPNGGVLDLNLGTQVPRPIIYKTILQIHMTILPNPHDQYVNLHDHYVNLHDHSAKST